MWNYLKSTNKPIVLYGMGNGADKILKKLYSLGVGIDGVFASDDFVRNHSFKGFKVMTYSEAKEKFGSMVVLLCFGTQRFEVMELIKKISREQELYAPDVPVLGNEIFDMSYYNKNVEKISKVYNMLEDNQSRYVFNNVIKFKLSGIIDYLLNCQTQVSEAYTNILKLSANEIYMDLGAYKGDTIQEFLQYVNSYKYIYAVEPDIKNFKKLMSNVDKLNNCECLNIGVSDVEKMCKFDMKSGRNTMISNEGTLTQINSIDGILKGNPVTYIKMDIEGQELNAIEGAKNTILKYKPKMLISCYHRTEDIYQLPMKVFSIRSDYKIYMRHYPYIPAWDTNFYFI